MHNILTLVNKDVSLTTQASDRYQTDSTAEQPTEHKTLTQTSARRRIGANDETRETTLTVFCLSHTFMVGDEIHGTLEKV